MLGKSRQVPAGDVLDRDTLQRPRSPRGRAASARKTGRRRGRAISHDDATAAVDGGGQLDAMARRPGEMTTLLGLAGVLVSVSSRFAGLVTLPAWSQGAIVGASGALLLLGVLQRRRPHPAEIGHSVFPTDLPTLTGEIATVLSQLRLEHGLAYRSNTWVTEVLPRTGVPVEDPALGSRSARRVRPRRRRRAGGHRRARIGTLPRAFGARRHGVARRLGAGARRVRGSRRERRPSCRQIRPAGRSERPVAGSVRATAAATATHRQAIVVGPRHRKPRSDDVLSGEHIGRVGRLVGGQLGQCGRRWEVDKSLQHGHRQRRRSARSSRRRLVQPGHVLVGGRCGRRRLLGEQFDQPCVGIGLEGRRRGVWMAASSRQAPGSSRRRAQIAMPRAPGRSRSGRVGSPNSNVTAVVSALSPRTGDRDIPTGRTAAPRRLASRGPCCRSHCRSSAAGDH